MYTLLERIKIRLRQFETRTEGDETILVFTHPEENPILEDLIEKAKQDIISYRHYPTEYTNEKIDADISTNYNSLVIDLVLYDYNIEGAENQQSHSENGVSRTYISRDKILGRVVPFIKVL